MKSAAGVNATPMPSPVRTGFMLTWVAMFTFGKETLLVRAPG